MESLVMVYPCQFLQKCQDLEESSWIFGLGRLLSSGSALELPDALRWRVGLAAFADMDAIRIYGAPLHAVSDSHRLQGVSDGCRPEGRHQEQQVDGHCCLLPSQV